MIRNKLKKQGIGSNPDFKVRGSDNTRIEALSDAVFAIAIALMLISSSIPETFDELAAFLEDFVPFGITITLLMLIWWQHYIFFLRYGLTDAFTVFLNTILLFLILFYVYPLKFLFKVLYKLFYALFTDNKGIINDLFTVIIKPEDTPTLMLIYGFGAFSIFLLMSMLYLYAYRIKDKLGLNEIEVFDTKSSIVSNLLLAAIPALSIIIAYFELGDKSTFMLAGIIYWLYPVIMPLYGTIASRRRKRLLAKLNVETSS